MARMLTLLLSVLLVGISGAPLPPAALAQQFPASAVIRGENIRLRLEPAANSEDVAILQRGNAVTITGDVTTADGLAFYPVELAETGDAGWVRDIFIKPSSIAPLPANQPAAEPPVEEAAPAEETVDEGDTGRRERPARQRRNQEEAAAEDAAPADEAPAEEAPAEEEAPPAAEEAPPAEEEAPPAEAVATATGRGNARSDRLALEPGRYRLSATLEADAGGNFVCNILGPEEFTAPLFDEEVNRPRNWTGETNLRIRGEGGNYFVECTEAPGAWTITFTPA